MWVTEIRIVTVSKYAKTNKMEKGLIHMKQMKYIFILNHRILLKTVFTVVEKQNKTGN